MREHILTDTREMAEKGFDLSPEFFRQLGKEDKALRMEARLANLQHQMAGATLARAQGEAPKRIRADAYAIDCIVAERRHGPKRFRVRWEGYHPSWEAWREEGQGQVGQGPLETWEPGRLLRNTEAFQRWRAQHHS